MGAEPAKDLDEESLAWLRRLGAGGGDRRAAELALRARLVRIALAELRRRAPGTAAEGQELDDVAHQAADKAMLAILAELGDFRGESRFTTWAYRFVIREVSARPGPPLPARPAGRAGHRTTGAAPLTGSASATAASRDDGGSGP